VEGVLGPRARAARILLKRLEPPLLFWNIEHLWSWSSPTSTSPSSSSSSPLSGAQL
jgi:hypothetical protein